MKLDFLHGQGVRIEECYRHFIAVVRISKNDENLCDECEKHLRAPDVHNVVTC
jgi:ubiquitin C-terminal hydrolase